MKIVQIVQLLGAFFITGNSTDDKYLDLINSQILPVLQQNDQLLPKFCIQQDGKPLHYDQQFKDFMDANFQNRSIRPGRIIKWSTQLVSFFPLGLFKQREVISGQVLERVTHDFFNRLRSILNI